GGAKQPGGPDLRFGGAVAVPDLAGRGWELALERVIGNENDPALLAVVDDVVRIAIRDVVMVLNRRDRDDLARGLDLVDIDGRDRDLPDLARVAVFRDRAEALLQRSLLVDAVQVVEVDRLGPEAPQALVDLRAELIPAAAAGVAALGRNHEPVGIRRERLADRALAVTA